MIASAYAQRNQKTTLPVRSWQKHSSRPARQDQKQGYVSQSLQLPRLQVPRLPVGDEVGLTSDTATTLPRIALVTAVTFGVVVDEVTLAA